MNKAQTGMRGELAAARWLREHGYAILAANYRCRMGEVDIIAADRTYICFVEVKTRAPQSLGTPSDAVTPVKRQRILAAAKLYLATHRVQLQPRFDVIEVFVNGETVRKVRLIPNAFDGEGI